MIKQIEYNGKIVIMEGGPGSGKSTQADLLVERANLNKFREPGGTEFGEAVRLPLQEYREIPVCREASLLGYMACRAQLYSQEIKPRVLNGEVVLMDRSWASTYAYQGAQGIDKKVIWELAEIATQGVMMPTVFLYYDLDAEVGQKRKSMAEQHFDRFDDRDREFFELVRQNYQELGGRLGPEKWVVIDASGSIEEVYRLTIKELARRNIV